MTVGKKPRVNSEGQRELDKAEENFKEFDDSVKSMTLDRMNMAPKENAEPQTKIAQSDIEKSKDVYLKPARSISSKERFNEKYREDFNFSTQFVQFIAENREIIGETIEMWTKPFAGMPAEFWQVPTNKPVWGPRHLAEKIKKSSYHRFVMENTTSELSNKGSFYGQMAVDTVVQRLDAHPVSSRKSIFMGTHTF